MRRHLSSGDAVPVAMPEYHELERVASEWEAWEVRGDRLRERGDEGCAGGMGRGKERERVGCR